MNIGEFERMASVGAGLALAVMGTGRIPWRAALAMAAGGALIYRGLTGHCHSYSLLGIDTAHAASAGRSVASKQGVRVDETILVNRSPEDCYHEWRRLENLPKFMRHLESVEVKDDRHSRWVARAPFGLNATWDAEIIGDRENEMIAWRSVDGSTIDTAGSVHFSQASDNAPTAVHVELKYDPIGGKAGAAIARLFGADAETAIRNDLRAWKEAMEQQRSKSAVHA